MILNAFFNKKNYYHIIHVQINHRELIFPYFNLVHNKEVGVFCDCTLRGNADNNGKPNKSSVGYFYKM